MNDEIKLEPCPFCGKEVELFDDMDIISCMATEGGCGFAYNLNSDVQGTDKGIASWNTRAISKEKEKAIATEFFYWWHNQPGNNTEQGFDEWWDKIGRVKYA